MGLSLFDDDVMPNVKEEIVQAMFAIEEKQVPAVSLENFRDRSMSSFATSNTPLLFKKLKIPDTCLQLLAIQWDENQDYQICKAFCRSLAYDHAKRSVALVQTFSGHLTKDELQYLLQVVTQHGKNIPLDS